MEIRFNHVSVLRAISFIFQIGNIIGVFHNNPFQLLGDTIARLLRRHFILIRMSDGFERGRSCDTAGWAGQGWHGFVVKKVSEHGSEYPSMSMAPSTKTSFVFINKWIYLPCNNTAIVRTNSTSRSCIRLSWLQHLIIKITKQIDSRAY